jgi:uncharacterized membrane protein
MEVFCMELTPEERRKIYEEEKTRIEAREQLERERGRISSDSTIDLTPGISGLLCYLGIWITGIIFFILEQKNKWVRFHAAQSIVVFGSLGIAMGIFGWIPFFGWFFRVILGITGFVLWIVLMVRAYQGDRFRVPIAADLAEIMVGWTFKSSDSPPPPPPAAQEMRSAPPVAAPSPPPPPPSSSMPPFRAVVETNDRHGRRAENFFRHRELRITGYAFALAWSVILLVALNFFHQYIAYYTYHAATSTWTWNSFFTDDIHRWLPILNVALVISIIGNAVMIFLDNNIVRKAIHVITAGFGLAAMITLLVVYPFDFSTRVIPNSSAAAATDMGVRIALIVITVGLGIGLLVRFIHLLVSIGKAVVRPSDDDQI